MQPALVALIALAVLFDLANGTGTVRRLSRIRWPWPSIVWASAISARRRYGALAVSGALTA
jgi:hypothetical protein